MNKPRILIIDDQLATDDVLREQFCQKCGLFEIDLSTTSAELNSRPDETVSGAVFCSGQIVTGIERANSIEEVLRVVESGWPSAEGWHWALILLDLRFDSSPPKNVDEKFGLFVLETLVNHWRDLATGEGNCEIPIVMLSVLTRNERSKEAGRAGAREYVEKSDLNGDLLQRLLKEHGLIEDSFGLVIGNSLPLLNTLRSAREVASDGRGNVLILGETGSGKTILAEYIHRHSIHAKFDYHSFTVGAGREPTILKADLYGYWHGAFTGAEKSESGKAERSHLSTLFIDEIGNLPDSGQAELLEYARLNRDGSRSFDRLGTFPTSPEKLVTQAKNSLIGVYNPTTQKISVNVFLITATNEPIDDSDHRKRIGFRDDLFGRLGSESHKYIKFPSLRIRPDDLVPLFFYYLKQASIENGGVWLKQIDPLVIERLRSYPWFGNVAELKGVVNYVEKNSRTWDEVLLRHLPPEITQYDEKNSARSSAKQDSRERRINQTPVGSKSIKLREVISIMTDAIVPQSRGELRGSLSAIQGAYQGIIETLLEVALEETKKLDGKCAPTSAVNLLLGKTIATPQAASLLLRLAKNFSLNPAEGSNLWWALQWSKKRRQTQKTESENDTDDRKESANSDI